MTDTQRDVPEFLATYMERQRAARADAVNAVLASLTDRERALIKDAAVMGYVRGMTHPKGEQVPKDGQIVAEVIDACQAFPDLYPTVNAEAPAVKDPLAEVLRIVRAHVIESNDTGGIDCNDLVSSLESAGYPLPDDEVSS